MSAGDNVGGQLRAFVERIELMDEEIKSMNDDKRDIYQEAKGSGFDLKALKKVISLRRMDKDARVDLDEMVELYERELGVA